MKSNFITRTITAFFFAVVLIGGISLHPITFAVLILLIIILGLEEFYRLLLKSNIQVQKYTGIFTGIILFASFYLYATKLIDSIVFLSSIPFFVLIFFIELYRKKENPFTNIALTIFGILYIALPFALFNFFAYNHFTKFDFNPNIILGYIFIIWLNDSGAYLTGMTFGKRKLFERISPKKSWEGSIGGAIIAMIAAYIISLFFKELTLTQWMILASIVIVTATYGDLAESLFKRSINIKDSGSILPGHGGILDRFDSVFLSAPIVFVYLQIIQKFNN